VFRIALAIWWWKKREDLESDKSSPGRSRDEGWAFIQRYEAPPTIEIYDVAEHWGTLAVVCRSFDPADHRRFSDEAVRCRSRGVYLLERDYPDETGQACERLVWTRPEVCRAVVEELLQVDRYVARETCLGYSAFEPGLPRVGIRCRFR